MMSPDHHHKFGAGRQAHFAHLDHVIGGGSALFRIGGEGILRFRHAHRQVAKTGFIELIEAGARRRVGGDAIGAVDGSGHRLGLFP
jgi:hypothetical protein